MGRSDCSATGRHANRPGMVLPSHRTERMVLLVSEQSPRLPWSRARGRIRDVSAGHVRPRCQQVSPRPNATRDLARLDASDEQRVRDQRPVAPPRQGFCAHQHDSFAPAELDAASQVLSECRGLHVIGIAPKAGVSPPHVRGVASGTTQAAQSGHVPVMNPSTMEGWRQMASIELRIVSRPRDRAHIEDSLDAMRL